VDGVSVRYGRLVAVESVSFVLAAGEAAALVGPNGGGKTSLLRAIAGVQPASGRVTVRGRTCHHEHVNAPVAYVAQRASARWDVPLTARDVVLAGCRARGSRWRRHSAHERADAEAALDLVGMRAHAARPVQGLSGGQAQRVLLARAFVQRPDVMLLDEPFAGLDEPSVDQVRAVLLDLCSVGVAVLCSLHELDVARRTFPRTIALRRHVIADGPTGAVLGPEGLERLFLGPQPVSAPTVGA
jgi:ABC-type Mn2+/Zn2+ transport system ATPase subunit